MDKVRRLNGKQSIFYSPKAPFITFHFLQFWCTESNPRETLYVPIFGEEMGCCSKCREKPKMISNHVKPLAQIV